MEINRTHCLRTRDLSDESVVVMEDMKGEIVWSVKVLAIASSSDEAAECVSRSDSL